MKEQLNTMVVEYQNNPNELILGDIFRKINPLIEKTSNDIAHLVPDSTAFDCRIITKANRLVEEFDENKDDFLSIIKTLISKEKSDFLRRRRKKLDETSLDALASAGEDGEGLGFQFEASDDIEAEIILKEKIALLAQGDLRKEMILTEWTRGADDKSISKLLAQHFGGNSESHRKFITRFKTKECRPFFAEAI